MHFINLASGSKGNCTIITSKNTKIIIDCGTTKKYLVDCFENLDFDYQNVDGLLITHTHGDHVSQLKMFSNCEIYSPVALANFNYHLVKPLEIFRVKDLTILPIPLSHDCDHTVGYILFDGQETLVYLTDSGYVSNSNLKLIHGADYYIIESNHDVDMLMATSRPRMLKSRIISDNGHLSNESCAKVISESIEDNTKEIILAHISQEANTMELAYSTMVNFLKDSGKYRENLFVKALGQYEIFDSEKLN